MLKLSFVLCKVREKCGRRYRQIASGGPLGGQPEYANAAAVIGQPIEITRGTAHHPAIERGRAASQPQALSPRRSDQGASGVDLIFAQAVHQVGQRDFDRADAAALVAAGGGVRQVEGVFQAGQ
jgi:hypothetical protein